MNTQQERPGCLTLVTAMWRADRAVTVAWLAMVPLFLFVLSWALPWWLFLLLGCLWLTLGLIAVGYGLAGKRIGLEEILLRQPPPPEIAAQPEPFYIQPTPISTPAPAHDGPPTLPPPTQPAPVPRSGSPVNWTGTANAARDRRTLTPELVIVLESDLQQAIKGQEVARAVLIRALKRVAAGVGAGGSRPLSLLLVGPTGVGKSQLAKATAKSLGRELIKFDIGQTGQSAGSSGAGPASWTLFGSPQGFQGGQGQLTSAVAANPDAVVLLDEIEKGDPQLFDTFLAILDEGMAKDNKTGQVVDFSKCIFFLSSNLITTIPAEVYADPGRARDAVLATNFLRPELVNRISYVVPMRALDAETLREIAAGHVEKFIGHTLARNGNQAATITVDRSVLDALVSRVDPKYGARDLERVTDDLLGDPLADALISHGSAPVGHVIISADSGRIITEVI